MRLLEDGKVYLGCQLERRDGPGCYGLAASESHILVCEYGEGGSNGEIVLHRRRAGRT